MLRVIKDHSVPTNYNRAGTSDQMGGSHSPEADRFGGRNWVFCNEGDLVIEVVKVKKSKLVGHSYVSGPAIQLMHYKANPDCFADEALVVGKLEIPELPTKGSGDEGLALFVEQFKSAIESAKLGNDITVLDLKVPDEEQAHSAMERVTSYWQDEKGKSHLIGNVFYGKDSGIHVHFQPEKHVTELYANFFQTELLARMVRKGK